MAHTKREPTSTYNTIWTIAAVAVVTAVVAGVLLWQPWADKNISDFQSCKNAGGAILESYPEQCTLDGKTFTNEAQSVNSSDAYIGLTEQAALDKAKSDNKTARVVERDGESLPVTMDFMPGRLNLHIKEGEVYKVQVEGSE